jgi:hypothetical protein
MFTYLVGRKFIGDPAQEIRRRLQEGQVAAIGPLQKGPDTGSPFLDSKGLSFPYTIMSKDVRRA